MSILKKVSFFLFFTLLAMGLVAIYSHAQARHKVLSECSSSYIQRNSIFGYTFNNYKVSSCIKQIGNKIIPHTNVQWLSHGIDPWAQRPCSLIVEVFDVTKPGVTNQFLIGRMERGNCQFGTHEYDGPVVNAIPGHVYLGRVYANTDNGSDPLNTTEFSTLITAK